MLEIFLNSIFVLSCQNLKFQKIKEKNCYSLFLFLVY